MNEQLAQSYAACHRMTRRARSSFPLAFLLLPADRRPAMTAIYAFNRLTDDLVDRPADDTQKRAAIEAWHAMLDADFFREIGDPATPGDSISVEPPQPLDSDTAELLDCGREILPALIDTARRFELPGQPFRAVVEGCEQDLQGETFETFEQLEVYCERVASAVGRMCIGIWGYASDRALEPARCCGVALQLTNILRDLVEDYENGRIYLPREDFETAGYDPAGLATAEGGPEFLALMRRQIERAESYYDRAQPLIGMLDRSGRPVCKMVIDVYHRLLEKIARRPEAVLAGRVRIGRVAKTTIFVRRLIESFFAR